MTAYDINSLARDAQTLNVAAFSKRYAAFFFVSLGQELQKTRVPMATHRWEPQQQKPRDPEATARVALGALAAQSSTLAPKPFLLADLVVFPVRRAATSQFPFVSIGRLEGNDVALGDPTVSKFHAYLKADANGDFVLLVDGRSQNGTLVGGVPVVRRGSDAPPTRLRSGDIVRFGSVSVTYLDAEAVVRLAQNANVAAPAFA